MKTIESYCHSCQARRLFMNKTVRDVNGFQIGTEWGCSECGSVDHGAGISETEQEWLGSLLLAYRNDKEKTNASD